MNNTTSSTEELPLAFIVKRLIADTRHRRFDDAVLGGMLLAHNDREIRRCVESLPFSVRLKLAIDSDNFLGLFGVSAADRATLYQAFLGAGERATDFIDSEAYAVDVTPSLND
jgi:hypothetical protein